MANISNTLRIVSWNVRGLGGAIKLSRVMAHLHQLKGHIFFIQETHLCNKEIARLKRGNIERVFHSKYNEKARGTAILISKNVLFEHHKSVLDPQGRFVIISGNLQGIPVILISVYGPNWDDSAFITKLFTSFPDVDNHYIIMGGDFNLVQDPVLDRSSPNIVPISKSAKTLNTFSKQLGLIDPWRYNFPTTKSFSFFSNVHHTYTRIDFFLSDCRLLSKINLTGYHSIVISDHAPITMDLNLDSQLKPSKRWRFTSALFSDDLYKQFLQSQIKLYFELNDLPCTSKEVLWEASKAYIRGQIISFSSNRKREERAHIADLLQKIKEIDESYASNPQPSKYSERLKLQTEFDLLSTNISKVQLLKSKQRFFESGDKAGRLLAQQTRSEATSRLIPTIKSDMGDLCTDATEINTIFSKFYANLYTSECPPPVTDILSHIAFPQVDPEAARKLGNPITTTEIREAIKSLQCNKSPGPDGYTAEYYKTFVHLLAPVLRDVYNEAFLKSRLPETFQKLRYL